MAKVDTDGTNTMVTPDRTPGVAMMLVMLPMWMNFLLRTYSWMSILENTGLLNRFFSVLLGVGGVVPEQAGVLALVHDVDVVGVEHDADGLPLWVVSATRWPT